MADDWNVDLKPCDKTESRYLAEFTWEGTADEYAEDRFKLWNQTTGSSDPLFPNDQPIQKDKTQAHYLVGARTMWILVCAPNDGEVQKFCNRVTGQTMAFVPPIQYSYWKCVDPQPLTK